MYCRLASREFGKLKSLLLSRYPRKEWACFLRLGWRVGANGLTLTLQALDQPLAGDLDLSVGHVAIQEPYSLRIALAAEQHPFAVAVIHSHPKDCLPIASPVDDDMDRYYADYFQGFTNGRPYVSLIVSLVSGELMMSGRVFWKQQWWPVTRFSCDGRSISTIDITRSLEPEPVSPRLARLTASFGKEAAHRLRRASVAVIGAGGTGSVAIEVLARAGIGKLIIVDPDVVEESNLERLHGGESGDGASKQQKVAVARRHVHSIDPSVAVITCVGSLPHPMVVDEILAADIVVGCTDQQHSRLALSEVAFRYLIPCIDCGVSLEGKDGNISGQTMQQVWFGPGRACALCREMVTADRIARELMSEKERRSRQEAARRANEQGLDPRGYWEDVPQLSTVGYLTSIAGAMAAGCAIGIITQRFEAPADRAQFNLFDAQPDVVSWTDQARPECPCQRFIGWAAQAPAEVLMTAPAHWPVPEVKRD